MSARIDCYDAIAVRELLGNQRPCSTAHAVGVMQQRERPIAAPIPCGDFDTFSYTESASARLHFAFSQRLCRVARF